MSSSLRLDHCNTTTTTTRRLRISVLLLWLLVAFCSINKSQSIFPVVLEVDEDESRCINFNVGENADAHLILLPLPHETQIEEQDLVETWYVQQVYKMLRIKTDSKSYSNKPIPLSIPGRIPESIEKAIAPFQRGTSKKNAIRVSVGVQGIDEDNPKIQYNTSFKAKYFQPLVLNNLRRQFAESRDRGNDYLMSVRLCISNEDEEEHVHVVFVKLMDGDETDIGDHDAAPIAGEEEETAEVIAARFEKDKHLSPLENSLQRSIGKANSVLRDMKFMELREKRLRTTSDSINTRIRWFAYFSVAILLAVTYLQVTYLKAYFHKKKVL
jgi:hypothetical protein